LEVLILKDPRRTHNLSSRVDDDIFIQLSNKANSRGITLNALVNNVLKHYVVWDQFAEEMGLMSLTKRTIKKIFNTMDEDEIKMIAKDVGGTVPQELIYLSYDKFDFDNLMKVLEISDLRFGSVRFSQKDSVYSVNVIHGICENFSKFLIESHQSLANKLSLKFTIEHMDDNMVCMEFEKPDSNEFSATSQI
jgi:hypothetical protein